MTNPASIRIGFVGAGRLASALAPALAAAGYPVTAISSGRHASAKALAARMDDSRAVDSAQEVADAVDLVFLTVPDNAIPEVSGSIRWRPGVAAVHCSGALGLDALSSASQAGADTGSFHPLQTFATSEAPLAGVTVAIDAGGSLLGELRS